MKSILIWLKTDFFITCRNKNRRVNLTSSYFMRIKKDVLTSMVEKDE